MRRCGVLYFLISPCWKLEIVPSSMASFSITGPIKYKTFTSFSQLSFSTTDNVSIPRKLKRKVGAHANFHPSFLNQSSWLSWHGSLYSEKQRGLSLIAFDAESSESEGEDNQTLETVMKFYSAFKNKRTHELSADERQRVTNFLSFFEAFQGRTVSFPPCLGGLNSNFRWDKISVLISINYFLLIFMC